MGVYIVFAFEGTMEHYFLFHTKNICWVLEESSYSSKIVNKDYTKYTLQDLPNEFTFEYDTGEYWTFQCKKEKKNIEKKSKKKVIVIEGAGIGLFEDNKQTLEEYLKGNLKKTFKKTKEELEGNEVYCLPWNIEMKELDDFDKPLDIDSINDRVEEQMKEFHIEQLKEVNSEEFLFF